MDEFAQDTIIPADALFPGSQRMTVLDALESVGAGGSTSADNIIIAPNPGTGQEPQTVGSAIGELISVTRWLTDAQRDAAAAGTSNTDLTGRLQDAEDYCGSLAASGQPVSLHWPASEYTIGSSIEKAAGVHWWGKGKIRRLDNADPAGAAFSLVMAENVDDWSIDGVQFEAIDLATFVAASPALTTGFTIGDRNSCLDVRGCDNWNVHNCTFRKFSFGVIFQGNNHFNVNDNFFFADNGKTIASMLDGTYVALANVNTGAIVTHYDASSPTPPSRYFRFSGNKIEAIGLDCGIQSDIYSFDEMPSQVDHNIIVGPHTGIQMYNGSQNDEPVATTGIKRAIIDSNYTYAIWEQGIYVRSSTGPIISGNWIERAGLHGAQASRTSSICAREGPYYSEPFSYAGLSDVLGPHIVNNTVLNHGRPGVACDPAILVEHNHAKVTGNRVARDAVAFPAKADIGIKVDNGKGLMYGEFTDNTVVNFANGIAHIGTGCVHSAFATAFTYERNACYDCALGINFEPLRAGLHRIAGNRLINCGTGVKLRYAPYTKVADNDFTACTIGLTIYQGTLASGVPYICTGADTAVAIGTRGGSTVVVTNNRYNNCTTAHDIQETGTNDTTFADRVHIWEGDRVNGAVPAMSSNARTSAIPDSVSCKSWSIGEVINNTVPGTGPSLRRCLTPGTYGSAVTPTVDATNATAIIANFSSLAGVGPGIYITIAGVTGTKLITGLTVYVDRFVGTGAQTVFTLSAAPANLAGLIVYKNASLQSSGVSVVTTALTFTTAPALGDKIDVVHLALTSMTLDSVVDATVAGAAIARATPTFVLDGGVLTGTATFNSASLADGAGETTPVTVTGAALGDFAMISHGVDLQGISVTAWVSAANTVLVRFQNESGGVLDIASTTLRAVVIPKAAYGL